MMKQKFTLSLLLLGMFNVPAMAEDRVVVIPLLSSSGGSSLWSNGSGDDIYRQNGNVGIGKTDPASKLDVNGVLRATGGSSTDWNAAYGWGDHSVQGYLTSYTETDPLYSAAPAAGITVANISNWHTAFSWGNHATQGYITTTTLAGDVTGTFGATVVGDDSHSHTDATVSDVITVANGSLYSQPTLRSDVGIGTTSPAASLHVHRLDTDVATISAMGTTQGSGMVYVGQSASYGGGISYDGDGTPEMVGGTDRITLFRRSNGVEAEVMSYAQQSSDVSFAGNVNVTGSIYGKLAVYSKQADISTPGQCVTCNDSSDVLLSCSTSDLDSCSANPCDADLTPDTNQCCSGTNDNTGWNMLIFCMRAAR